MSKTDWIEWCILRSGLKYPEWTLDYTGKEVYSDCRWFNHPEHGTLFVYEYD